MPQKYLKIQLLIIDFNRTTTYNINVFFTPFYLIILKLNNELCEELPELFQMADPYGFMTNLCAGINRFPDNN